MTKVTVLGITNNIKPRKKIQFVKILTNDSEFEDSGNLKPSQYEYIELIAKDYSFIYGQYRVDLMFCFNHHDARGEGILVLGHFNDGIV